jgi:hypothetical protein
MWADEDSQRKGNGVAIRFKVNHFSSLLKLFSTVKNPPPSPHPQPFFPPAAPPFGLILPPPDIPMARGTPVPIEDLDSIQQPENQNNAGFGQTQVEAASSPEPELFPTLMPSFVSSNSPNIFPPF